MDARWRIVKCCHKPGYLRAEGVMSRGLGRIERVIAARIASDAAYPMAVRLGSGQLAHAVYRPAENSGAGIGNPGTLWSWKPNLVQRALVQIAGAGKRPVLYCRDFKLGARHSTLQAQVGLGHPDVPVRIVPCGCDASIRYRRS